MTVAISPVYAPTLCSLMFCAPSRRFELSISFETSESAVNGGHTTMSTSFTPESSSLRSRTRSTASATVLFIFQLPAMMSLRCLFMIRWLTVVRQRRDAGKGAAFEEFQAGAAAGAHERHAIAELRLVQRLH